MAMITINSGKQLTLQEAADLSGYKVADLDSAYGVVWVGENTCVVRTLNPVVWGQTQPQQFSDPIVAPFGPVS